MAIESCLVALLESADELAKQAFGLHGARRLATDLALPHEAVGSYVPLVSEQLHLALALMASPEGCQQFAKTLLTMDLTEPDLTDPDMQDALGEIVNILAGSTKSRLQSQYGTLKIGLPCFATTTELSNVCESAIAACEMGDMQGYLSVFRLRE